MKVCVNYLLAVCGFALIASSSAGAADKMTLEHGGSQRSYLLHVPKTNDAGKPAPLLIALHGTNMRAETMLAHTDLVRKADAAGFILVLPDSRGLAFNDGSSFGGADSVAADDVGFIEALAEDVKRRHKVNADAMFLTGFSSGGSMTQRVLIESRYPFAAYASVANNFRVATSGMGRPAPLLLVFGTADPLNPVAGGQVSIPVTLTKPSHESTAMNWVTRMDCKGPAPSSATAPKVIARSWKQCAGGASLTWYSIDGLGHHWSGAEPMPFPSFVIGEQLDSPNLSDLIWEFFVSTRK
ncbi:MAG TPA: PHB depolymerase family esterase [Ramlibacter sp.]|nr:PHB depolymerase family esterase [Ramlibacter sp.]